MMFNPFKKLVEAFNKWAGLDDGVRTSPELADYVREIGKANGLTPFEKMLFDSFERMHGNRSYSAICVCIKENAHAGNLYLHPVTDLPVKGEVIIALWTRDLEFRAHLNTERRMGRQPVMVFDLSQDAPTLQQQMPSGWRPGTIPFPHKFLDGAHIRVPHNGELVNCKKLQGIGLIDDPEPVWTSGPSKKRQVALPAEYVKVAFCINEAGEKREVPEHIRGVFFNDNVRKSHRGKPYADFPRQI